MSAVQRWLSVIGDAAIEEYPPLAVLAGWVAALAGQTAEAQRWASIIERRRSTWYPPMVGVVRLGAGDAAAHMCPRPEQAMADAPSAVAAEPPWSPWRDQALNQR